MYSKDTLTSKTPEELATIAQALGSSLTAADGTDALIAFITNGAAVEETPAPPKRRRGRPTKAEVAAREAAKALEAAKEEEKTEEVQDNPTSSTIAAEEEEPAKTGGKRRRARKTKEEIAAAAAAAAAALVRSNQRKAAYQQELNFQYDDQQPETATEAETTVETAAEPTVNAEPTMSDVTTEVTTTEAGEAIPEQTATTEDEAEVEGGEDLVAQLQAKVEALNEAQPVVEDKVWENDPADGTDFIIVEDIPLMSFEENISYDMLDNPIINSRNSFDMGRQEKVDMAHGKEPKMKVYDFSDLITINGVLEIMPDGFGFLRSSDYNYLSSPDDIFVTAQQIKRNSLKTGDVIECAVRPPQSGEKFFTLTEIKRINGCDPIVVRDRVAFENLTPLFPDEKFTLCGDARTTNRSVRIVDLFSPIGKGQRALIVAQPKTGKTILMKDIANAISANHPEAYLMMLLIDERPEEVTDMARTVDAEVIASTFDEPAEHHVKIAGIVLEKAKRLVECGHDVVIFLDSITRLARAYNTVAPASGKILTGGVDANALQKPKRFFGAARNIEGGGSLTIIATALIDTGSKMDEVIFEEFKGTGNMELQLDRSLSNKRIFPAVNLIQSSTRRDDLLHDKTTLDRMWILRKHIAEMNAIEAMTLIDKTMTGTRTNEEFLISMNS